jgi:intracellular septation protein A
MLTTVPDEVAEPPAPPTLRSVLRKHGGRFATDSVIPVVLFLVLNGTAGIGWAMVASTVWAVSLIGLRLHRHGAVGVLVWFSLGFVVVRGVAGLLARSDAVYFGPGILNTLLVALAFAGSVCLRRPIVGMIAPIFYPFPDDVRAHPTYRRVFSRLTLAWAALLASSVALQIWLLATASTNTYLVVRSAVTWPLSLALFVISLRYPRRAFERHPELSVRLGAAPGPAVS